MIGFTKQYEEVGVHAPAWHDCRLLAGAAAQQVTAGAVTVVNGIPPGLLVYADPLIGAVFANLIDNATRHGGMVTTIAFSARQDRGALVITCQDDGDGIPAGEKERIFEPGYGKNTGLGLALAREILAITGITIAETGTPGRGASFAITVPPGTWRAESTPE